MIQNIFLHIISKVLKLLIQHKDFFTMQNADKEKLIKDLPNSVQPYLLKATEEDLINDLKELLSAMHSGIYSKSTRENGLAIMLANYLINELGSLMDRLPIEFYELSQAKRHDFLNEKMKLPPIFIEIFSGNNYQDIFENAFDYIKKIKPDFPYIVIQMARDPEANIKQEMRKHFREKVGESFPRFQISKYLLGGMRILVNGEITDQSWTGKIERFTSQLTLNRS